MSEISRENADPGSYYKSGCGCEIWNQGGQGGQFVIMPCSLTCENYLYAVQQSQAAGNPIEYRYKE